MQPTIGRIVHYTLNAADADAINRRRGDAVASRSAEARTGAVLHHGNSASEGDVYPAMVVRVFGSGTTANLQVFLDGNDSYWATSRREAEEGESGGFWVWPPRV